MKHNELTHPKLTQPEFNTLVCNTLAQHPEWMAETLHAMQAGMLHRIDDETEHRAGAETAVTILADNFKSIPKHQQVSVARVICNTKMFKGTPYANKLAKKYGFT